MPDLDAMLSCSGSSPQRTPTRGERGSGERIASSAGEGDGSSSAMRRSRRQALSGIHPTELVHSRVNDLIAD